MTTEDSLPGQCVCTDSGQKQSPQMEPKVVLFWLGMWRGHGPPGRALRGPLLDAPRPVPLPLPDVILSPLPTVRGRGTHQTPGMGKSLSFCVLQNRVYSYNPDGVPPGRMVGDHADSCR